MLALTAANRSRASTAILLRLVADAPDKMLTSTAGRQHDMSYSNSIERPNDAAPIGSAIYAIGNLANNYLVAAPRSPKPNELPHPIFASREYWPRRP